MKILVANIGSTSFKFRLLEISQRSEREIAVGAADYIGESGFVPGLDRKIGEVVHPYSKFTYRLGAGKTEVQHCGVFADHGMAIRHAMEQLITSRALASKEDLDVVAFKAVLAGDCEPVALVDDKLIKRMEYFSSVAPAHNPPYIAAMQLFRDELGEVPLVAVFEPGFHGTIPPWRRYYAVPMKWAEKYGVKRYGFHGASHRYIAMRTAELMPEAKCIISCHLGGSSSICAIRDGQSVATSFGLSTQSGLPQTNRCGEFDPFAFALLKAEAGMDADAVLQVLGSESGLAALSGTNGDMRQIHQAADAGDEKARLALDVYVTAVRDYIGAYLVELGGADALVFTGGIGQNDPELRAAICAGMEFVGISIDAAKNDSAKGESRIDAEGSPTAVWVVPTNEELIVARQAAELLSSGI